ncbi:MAG: membrane protein insertion efficiency factor YidD [Myxococcales bacterium]|nr:membrane protein insertion efficiency factor YidD [Myxococcales bacterium]
MARALDSVRPPSAVARLLLAVVGLYRHRLSPLLPPACRFTPSCSAYATDALERHPLPRALSLTAWRLARCQPFSRGGHDPVPLPRTQA